MWNAVMETCVDILKAAPVLLAVYTLMYFIETRMRATPALLERAHELGPVFGALAGAVPQCGFSAAAATLYNAGYLAPATLIAVFVSTSDEAIPVLLAHPGASKNIILFVLCKLLLAIVSGYLLELTVFRKHRGSREKISVDMGEGCGCCGPNPMAAIAGRTVKTSLFLLVTMLAINLVVALVGQQALSSILLQGSPLQPALCAVIGLIPGCAVSVLLTELFLGGTLSFGAVIAGLSTGAGFGYVLLLSQRGSRKNAVRIIAVTWLVAAAGGTLLQFMLG